MMLMTVNAAQHRGSSSIAGATLFALAHCYVGVIDAYGRPGTQSKASRCPSEICAGDIFDATALRRRWK
jgi:hypothetical protein